MDLLGQVPQMQRVPLRLAATIGGLGLPEHMWLDEFGRALVRCFESAAALNGKARWADKNPENALNVRHWARLLNGDFDFVMVVRHPFDIVASLVETKWGMTVPPTLDGKAAHVRAFIESGLDFCEAHPQSASIVRYEALVADPEATLTELLCRLGEEFEPAMISDLNAAYHLPGLGDPKCTLDTISRDSVRRWETDFTPGEIAALEFELGTLRERLGYDATVRTTIA